VLHDDAPSPTRFRPGLPRDVEAICLKCLEKEVCDRYGSAEDLANDLQRFAEHKPITARRTGIARRAAKWMKRRPQMTVMLCVLTLLVAAIAAGWPVANMVTQYREREERRVAAIQVAPLVREILERNCFECHGGDETDIRKQLNILDHTLLIDSQRRIVVPGQPSDSRLIQRIADGSMPPEKRETELPRLSQRELEVLDQWILGGAPRFPDESEKSPVPRYRISLTAIATKEIFQRRCYECHSYDVAEGGIKILHHRLLLHVRKVIVPGKPEESELFQLIVSKDEEAMMPPATKNRLTPNEIETIRNWILQGAPPFPKTNRQQTSKDALVTPTD